MIPILLIAALILLLIWGIATYNRLVTERLKVQTQWSQINVVRKQRFDLLPNLQDAALYDAMDSIGHEAAEVREPGFSGGGDSGSGGFIN